MSSEKLKTWERLCEDARLCQVSQPVLTPSHFTGSWVVTIDGHRHSARDPDEAIDKAVLWLSGYAAALVSEEDRVEEYAEVWSRECDLAEAASLCKEVIESHGRRNGDLEDIARAVLLLIGKNSS